MGYLNGQYARIVIETDEDEPRIIAEITEDDINPAHGYRVRLKPSETD